MAASFPNSASLQCNASRRSRWADGARITRKGAPDLSTLAPKRKFGRDFPPKVIDMPVEFFQRAKLYAITVTDLLKPFPSRPAQPFQLRLLLLLAFFEQAQPFANHLTGIAVAAGANTGFN